MGKGGSVAADARVEVISNVIRPGIQFQDVTTILLDPVAFKHTVDLLNKRYCDQKVDVIAGFEARGLIFGAPLAIALGCAFVPLRKPGKLPGAIISADYVIEYSTDQIEMHVGALQPRQRVVLVDDLIATGSTLLGIPPSPAAAPSVCSPRLPRPAPAAVGLAPSAAGTSARPQAAAAGIPQSPAAAPSVCSPRLASATPPRASGPGAAPAAACPAARVGTAGPQCVPPWPTHPGTAGTMQPIMERLWDAFYAEEAGRAMRAAGMRHELMVELGQVYCAAADEWLSYALHSMLDNKHYSDMRVTIRSFIDAARGQH